MKLAHVSIRNFRSIKEMEFDFPQSGILVLVGANNAGKSNIIRAINCVCGEDWFGPDKAEDYDHYLRDRNRGIGIALRFDDGTSGAISPSERWPRYLDRHGRKIWDANLKDDFPCTYLGADRSFARQLSFYDWTLIGRIRRTFHRRALPLQDELRERFQNVVEVFDEVDGFAQFKSDFTAFFSEMQADSRAKLSLDFKPFTPSNYFKTMQILASDPDQSDQPLDLEELGEGSRNMVLLALLRSYALNLRSRGEIGGILALEEPEVFLHPQARRHLGAVLHDIAESGMQVILSTHSDSFVDVEHFDSIGRVFKVPDDECPGRTHTRLQLVARGDLVGFCTATGVPEDRVTTDSVAEYYSSTSNPKLNEGFFARCVVLVEGETEELALPVYLRAAGLDCDACGTSILKVVGKNQLPKYWRLFACFKVPTVIVCDGDEGKGSNTNLATCFGLKKDDFSVAKGEWEVLHSTSGSQTPILVFGADFETAVRAAVGGALDDGGERIDAYESDARQLIQPVGDGGKQQIARYVARHLVNEASFRPGFADALAGLIRSAVDGSADVPVEDGEQRLSADDEEETPF